MGTLLALAGYAAYAVFGWRSLILALALRRAPAAPENAAPGSAAALRASLKAALDLLFMMRLLRANDVLWVLEWLFHVSLGLVALRHLRYVLEPVPAWVATLQPLGLAAGYVLPVSLAAILAAKWGRRGEGYFSSENFLLLTLLLLGGATGLGMTHLFPIDLVAAKVFMLGFFAFRPQVAPAGVLFTAHVLLAFFVLARLPFHVVAAPLSLLEANRRDLRLERLLRD